MGLAARPQCLKAAEGGAPTVMDGARGAPDIFWINFDGLVKSQVEGGMRFAFPPYALLRPSSKA